MTTPEFDLQKAHRHFSVTCFNEAWSLIDKTERTPDEDEQMLRLSVASAWHWTLRDDCTPQNLSIAYWQISRVHALVGRGDEAARYGQMCLQASQGEGIAPFALGYAYEALARAEAVRGNPAKAKGHLRKAREVAETLTDEDTGRCSSTISQRSAEAVRPPTTRTASARSFSSLGAREHRAHRSHARPPAR